MSSVLNFTKEEVQPVIVTSSLLGSTLASPRHDTLNSSSSSSMEIPVTTRMTIPSTVSASHPLSSSYGKTGHYRTIFTVTQVVSSVMTKYMNDKGIFSSPTSPNSFGRTPSYALMIADDDGNIDQDFPEVDGNVSLTSIGVNKFIICDTTTMKPLITLVIPEAAMTIKAADTHRQAQNQQELLLTCTPFMDDQQSMKDGNVPNNQNVPFSITLVSD